MKDYTENDVRTAIRVAIAKEADGKQNVWAEKHGISASYLSDILRGNRDVAPRVAALVGFEGVTVWRKRPAK